MVTAGFDAGVGVRVRVVLVGVRTEVVSRDDVVDVVRGGTGVVLVVGGAGAGTGAGAGAATAFCWNGSPCRMAAYMAGVNPIESKTNTPARPCAVAYD